MPFTRLFITRFVAMADPGVVYTRRRSPEDRDLKARHVRGRRQRFLDAPVFRRQTLLDTVEMSKQ